MHWRGSRRAPPTSRLRSTATSSIGSTRRRGVGSPARRSGGRPPFDGGVFIADTSAWARAAHPAVAEEWKRALAGRQIATTPIVKLELLYSTRDGSSFDELARDLSALRDVPLTRSVTDAALAAMRTLAHVRPLHHRVRLADLLVAAAAEDSGIGVLHYDRHYDRLSEVMSFGSRWLAPPGSLD
jgi:predicted nucleic acid-binding protein